MVPQCPTKFGVIFPSVFQLGLDDFAHFVSRRASVDFRAFFQLAHGGLVYVVDPERRHAPIMTFRTAALQESERPNKSSPCCSTKQMGVGRSSSTDTLARWLGGRGVGP